MKIEKLKGEITMFCVKGKLHVSFEKIFKGSP
jgi:hypothetical protein